MESIDQSKRQIYVRFCYSYIQSKHNRKCDETIPWPVVSTFLIEQTYASWNRLPTE
jgi:hypothetical protein